MNIEKFRDKLNIALKNKDVSYVLKGSALTAISMVVVQIIRMAGGVIIGRYYGPTVHGTLGLLTVLVTSVIILANFGIKDVMLRLIPEYNEKGNLKTSWDIYLKGVKLLFAFSIIGSIIIVLIVPWFVVEFGVPQMRHILTVSAFFIFPLMLNELNLFTLRALFKIKKANAVTISTVVARLIALVFVTAFFYDIDGPLYVYLFIMCLFAAIISTISIFRHFYLPAKDLKSEIQFESKELLILAFPMMLTYASFLINDKTDSLMIQWFTKSPAQLGIYSVCLNLANLGRMGMQAMNVTIQPKLSQMFHTGRIHEIKNVTAKASKTFALLNVPITLVLVFGSAFLLGIYGPAYKAGATALSVLAIGQMFNTFAGPTAQLMNVTGHHKQFMWIAFFGAVLNVVLNCFMIPAYGILGAAISSASSMIVWNFIATVFIYKTFGFFVGYIPILSEKYFNK